MDGVEKVYIKNIEVYDLVDSTPVGKETCGSYSSFCGQCDLWGGHFRQTIPMQIGFSGNMNQGININAAQTVTIEDAYVHDIESETGPAFGISIWPSCDVTLEGDIIIENLNAGTQIEEGTYGYEDLPNKAPEACGLRVYYEYGSYTTELSDNYANYKIDTDTIAGHVGCLGSEMYDFVGENEFSQYAYESDDEAEAQGHSDPPQRGIAGMPPGGMPMDKAKEQTVKEKEMSKFTKFGAIDKFKWFAQHVSLSFLVLVIVSVACFMIGSYYFYHSYDKIKSRVIGGCDRIKHNNNNRISLNSNTSRTYGTPANDPNIFVF